jgi:hypothetical protein
MKAHDAAVMLKNKLDDKLAPLAAQWKRSGTGTTLETQFGWLADLPDASQVRF